MAGGTPDPGTGNSRDNQLLGSFNNTNGPAGGDFVNSAIGIGLDSDWIYKIEVPPSQSNLTVEIFDADVRGKFAPGEIHDTADDNNANGALATYRLINPLGVTVATQTIGQDTAFDNTWAQPNSNFSVTNPIPGHWTVEYDLVSTTNAQGNTYGVRAHDGTSGSGGTEYNMYSPTYVPVGHGEDTDSTNPGNEDQNYYPYVTRGCTIDVNDFDLDFDGSYDLTSPTGDSFSSPAPGQLSGNGVWNQENYTGWASADTADDYGLWDLFFDGLNTNGVNGSVGQNLGALYVGDETTTNPTPTTNPIPNAFRIYFPADGSAYADGSGSITDPTLPYLTQTHTQTGNTVTVTVSIINPARANGSAALPVEFDTATSGTNVVTVTVPANGGASTVTAGSDSPSQGTSQISGNTVTWAAGSVAGATTQTLTFDIELDPSFGLGPFDVVDSTVATFIDQTCAGAGCSGAQLTGATTTFGPLCPLSATAVDAGDITGSVLLDNDFNNTGETPQIGVTVQLFADTNGDGQPDGPVITSVTTDNSGNYIFEDVPVGDYVVVTTNPAGTVSILDQDEQPDGDPFDGNVTVDNQVPVTVTTGEIDSGNNFIDQPPLGSIAGTIWNDIDANGADNGEPNIGGITVNLLDSGGNVIDTVVTMTDGSYLFPDLPPADYTVVVDTTGLPTGSNVADPSQTGDPDESGVCAVCDSMTTTAITLTAGQNVTDVDFGYTGDSLPVTLSSISSERLGSKVKVDWITSSELFNVGFQLWGLDGHDNKWEKMHAWLVRSGAGNAVEPQSYTRTSNIPASIRELVAVGISSVDSDGSEHYYGPFELGKDYGNLASLKPIAWDHIRDQVDARMQARGYTKDRVNGYRRLSSSAAASSNESVVDVRVNKTGMYRITSAQLLSAGVDWSNLASREIALLDHAGQPVVRYVLARGTGSGLWRKLGTNGEIYFHARAPQAADALYSSRSHYRLVADKYQALIAPLQVRQGVNSGFSDLYRESLIIEDNNQYSLSAQADDPWVERIMTSYTNRSSVASRMITLPSGVDQAAGMALVIGVGRASSLRAVDADGNGVQDKEHVITAAVAGEQGQVVWLDEVSEVGRGAWQARVPITTVMGDVDPVQDGLQVNVGASFTAGPGYAFSSLQLDHMGLIYSRAYEAKADHDYLAFAGPGEGELGYDVVVPELGGALVFAHDGSNLVRLVPENQAGQTSAAGERQRVVRFAQLNGSNSASQPVQYWVSGARGFLAPESIATKVISSKDALLSQAEGSNYLIIAHPSFMGSKLEGYANFKRSRGYGVSIINYLDVVEVFGSGQAGPTALSQYLSTLNNLSGQLEHVLLVGGSVYDHLDQLETGALTFIPGHYGESGYSKFTVTDLPYVMDAQGAVFANIGRWPVRSISDLVTIVDKSIAWSSSNHTHGQALLIAENTLAPEAIDFSGALDSLLPQISTSWTTSKVYVDEIQASNPGYNMTQTLNAARSQIIDALNNAPDVVLYNGHGTTNQLSNQGLFKAQDVSSITASGAEWWIPMSCYVTYYESTHVNTLAHQLMFDGNAVGISGAMLLSNQAQNIAVGRAILDATMNHDQSVGDALNAYKATQKNARLNVNWSVLGDTTLHLNQ